MYQYNDYELLYLIVEKDDTALDIMYQKYIPLIKARINGFRIKQNNYEDFFQEGLLMLFKAITTYKTESKKTFNKYFDLILQRRFIQILKKESVHFYNVDLIEDADLLMEKPIIENDHITLLKEIIEICKFSRFEEEVLELITRKYKTKEISESLNCDVKKVYDATDRIKRKVKRVKIALDKKIEIC
jgi:RNA polymerase sporulation-specific sigma factor